MNAAGGAALIVLCDWSRVAAPERLLGPRERHSAAGLEGARRHEWVRTRLTAKAAVRWFAGPAADPRGFELLSAPDGAPEPIGAAVSISLAHTGNLSLCAVSPGGTAVGVDAERIDQDNDLVRRKVEGPRDLVPIRSTRPGAEATLLFACKEAAYKAYRGASPVLRDYRVSADRGGFGIGLDRPGGRELTLWPALTGTLALAFCQDRPEPPRWRRVLPARVLTELRAEMGGREDSECHS